MSMARPSPQLNCYDIVYDAPVRGGDSVLALIDTDPGIDDALALLFAWGSPDLRLAGITTVAGNVPVEAATHNLLRLMALRGITTPPPIAQGAAAPLARSLRTATAHHGEDGLGDLPDWPATALAPAARTAAELIVHAARGAGEALTLIALGPLTNVALALERDAAALGRLARVVVMGGAVDVPGNVTAAAEFNIHVDPEAAARVLAAGLPLDLVPLDATRQAVLTRDELDRALRRRPGPIAERIGAFTRYGFRSGEERATSGMALHDPLAVAVALDPTLVDWEVVRLTIGPEGETRRAPGAPNCRFARTVDARRFLAVFLERLCPGS
jgi:pyrimidine-specific ribonucleoside hydrolase